MLQLCWSITEQVIGLEGGCEFRRLFIIRLVAVDVPTGVTL